MPHRPAVGFLVLSLVFCLPWAAYAGSSNSLLDVSPDGRRFMLIKDAQPANAASAPPPQLVVVLNWFEELKQRVSVH